MPAPGVVTCRELLASLDRQGSAETPADTRQEYELHLAQCPACAELVELYRQSGGLVRDALATPDTLIEELPEALVQAILERWRRDSSGSGNAPPS